MLGTDHAKHFKKLCFTFQKTPDACDLPIEDLHIFADQQELQHMQAAIIIVATDIGTVKIRVYITAVILSP